MKQGKGVNVDRFEAYVWLPVTLVLEIAPLLLISSNWKQT